ncbi:ABC transporter substrate-binding protein [Lentzea sp. NPDC051213]|uniref:ABC transporter substrate-binding protein n=1 Tax=Lentzea sp. NPDC051213 TaxID=3364126 RepID=UPI0037914CAF
MSLPVRLTGTIAAVTLAAGCAAGASGPDAPASGAVAITSCGKQLSFTGAPHRVVSLDQASTETLLALGAKDKMVGTANLKTKPAPRYADDYAKVPVLSPKILTAEPLRAANPDFVVSGYKELFTADRAGTRDELAALDVPTFVSAVNCPDGTEAFERLFRDYADLGKAMGVSARADQLIAEQRAVISEVQARKPAPGLKVAWVYSVFKGVPYVAGKAGMPGAISKIAGVTNVFDDMDQEWPEVSWETVAERAPDVIVIGDLSERGNPGDKAEEKIAMMREHPMMAQLPAVRDNKIIKIPGIELDASVRTVDALRAFSAALPRG